MNSCQINSSSIDKILVQVLEGNISPDQLKKVDISNKLK